MHLSLNFLQMGRRSKSSIGRNHKNWEKKQQSLKKQAPGCPRKQNPTHLDLVSMNSIIVRYYNLILSVITGTFP